MTPSEPNPPTPRSDAFRKMRLLLTETPEEDYLAELEINFARTLETELAAKSAEVERLTEADARNRRIIASLQKQLNALEDEVINGPDED
jgi:hypothetical protein